MFCDFIFITQPCSWVHLSLCICIVEKYLGLHFVAAQLVRGVYLDTGSNGRHPATSLACFLFCCAVLKRDEAAQQEAVSGSGGGGSHYHLREQEQVAPGESQPRQSQRRGKWENLLSAKVKGKLCIRLRVREAAN